MSRTKGPSKAPRKKRALDADDTPKAFKRLMAPGRAPRFSEDTDSIKKRKKGQNAPFAEAVSAPKPEPMRILPSESLSQFSARVDQSLSLKTMPRSSVKNPQEFSLIKKIDKSRKTKTEVKMQKMQHAWREEQARRDARKAEQEDEMALDDYERLPKHRDRGLKRSRTRTEGKGIIGLHDVVHAPPSLPRVSQKFK